MPSADLRSPSAARDRAWTVLPDVRAFERRCSVRSPVLPHWRYRCALLRWHGWHVRQGPGSWLPHEHPDVSIVRPCRLPKLRRPSRMLYKRVLRSRLGERLRGRAGRSSKAMRRCPRHVRRGQGSAVVRVRVPRLPDRMGLLRKRRRLLPDHDLRKRCELRGGELLQARDLPEGHRFPGWPERSFHDDGRGVECVLREERLRSERRRARSLTDSGPMGDAIATRSPAPVAPAIDPRCPTIDRPGPGVPEAIPTVRRSHGVHGGAGWGVDGEATERCGAGPAPTMGHLASGARSCPSVWMSTSPKR